MSNRATKIVLAVVLSGMAMFVAFVLLVLVGVSTGSVAGDWLVLLATMAVAVALALGLTGLISRFANL